MKAIPLSSQKPDRLEPDQFSLRSEVFSEEEYLSLIEALNWHSYCYHTLDEPTIADVDYDRLMSLLQEVEEKNPQWKRHHSPTQKVGSEIREELPKVEHDPPMMSLDNASDWEAFLAFHERVQKNLMSKEKIIYHCEPKFDGLGIELIYKNGILTTGSTRGNGEFGEDITHNIKTIRNIPLRLLVEHPPEYLSVRGECVLPISEFERINEEMGSQGKNLFSNPRNMASGTLRQLDSSLTAKRKIKFFPYSIGKIIESDQSKIHNSRPDKQEQIYSDYLKTLGFFIFKLPSKTWGTARVLEVRKIFAELKIQRSKLDFDTDGLVIKLNDTKKWQKLGRTSKAPRYAIALKFPPKSAITKIEDVFFQVGRTGVITPVARLKPINIGGVMVRRASLHNASEIKKLNISTGDLVEVQRAGDVIPKVVSLQKKEKNSKKIRFPTSCPSCGQRLYKEKIHYRCQNNDCSDKNLAGLIYISSKSGLDIENLGQEWVTRFYEKGLMKDISDIFSLKIGQIQDMEGMGDILPQKMIASIEAKKRVSYAAFLRALGIPNIGSHMAEVLAQNFKSLDSLKAASSEELTSIHEIGRIVAESIVKFFQDDKNQNILDRLFQTGFKIEYSQKTKEPHPFFEGKSFIFTGSLEAMTRPQAQEIVKMKGGKINSSVSPRTDYIVLGKKSGSKLRKADELRVSILTEKEFLDKIYDKKQ